MDFYQLAATITEWLTLNGIKILVALAIFVVGRWVARALTKVVDRVLRKNNLDAMIVSFAGNLAYATMLAFVVIAALGQIGIQTASFVAIIGAAGLAVGLALQGSLANFASGVLMLIFKPFKVGDFIEAGGASGSVKEVQIFCTQLTTPDNKLIIVPNSAIMGGNITNVSAQPTRRVDLVVGVSYSTDLAHAKLVLNDIVNADDRILKDPAPMIAVSELADSTVNLVLRPWVKSADYWGVYFDVTEKIKNRFDQEGIEIPFPQMDVNAKTTSIVIEKSAATSQAKQ